MIHQMFSEKAAEQGTQQEKLSRSVQCGEASTKSTNLENFVAPSKLHSFLDCTPQLHHQPSKGVGEDKRKRGYRVGKF